MKTILITCVLLMLLAMPCLADGEATVTEKPSHEVLGLLMTPYSALTLSRVSGAGEWSTGFLSGVEIDAGGGFVALEIVLHDILTEAHEETMPWDSTFHLKLGMYW